MDITIDHTELFKIIDQIESPKMRDGLKERISMLMVEHVEEVMDSKINPREEEDE